ncbi:hypothetical protein [Rhodococcus marinonascens]|uniref:hypothetical protein n=1 Tax=Rhodococcus marinonascens TaxID=38311 RepID=UPI00093347CB|nr:hypothetical protein [Rhodococcus marinonascens]
MLGINVGKPEPTCTLGHAREYPAYRHDLPPLTDDDYTTALAFVGELGHIRERSRARIDLELGTYAGALLAMPSSSGTN